MTEPTLPSALYNPKPAPALITVPPGNFICIAGIGDPNGEPFALATAALYSLAYAVKMSYKSPTPPAGYSEYKVYPLEADWGLSDPSLGNTVRENWAYELMIRQPAFLTAELFARFASEVALKKPNPVLGQVRFQLVDEGRCCQALHVGPYASEPETFTRIEAFLAGQDLRRASRAHREVYLSDPRKTAPEKLRTILRVQVAEG